MPEWGYVYFGQRKNVWLYNVQTDACNTYAKTTISDTDAVRNDYFVDWFVGDDFPMFSVRSHDIRLVMKDGRVLVICADQELDCTDIFQPVQKIDPLYGIEPNIG